ncbi:MAG: hypothetical protein ACREKN_02625 [Longimicrobiaceae bacterium]
MNARRWLALATLPLFLAACEPGDGDDTAMDDDTMEAWEDTAAMDEMEMGEEESVSLGDLNDSGIGGDVRFTALGEETDVMLEINDAPGNTEVAAHLHTGESCDDYEEAPEHPLESVTTDAEGSGASTTTLSVALADVMDGGHVVIAHGADGQPVSCGEIPEHGELMDLDM